MAFTSLKADEGDGQEDDEDDDNDDGYSE